MRIAPLAGSVAAAACCVAVATCASEPATSPATTETAATVATDRGGGPSPASGTRSEPMTTSEPSTTIDGGATAPTSTEGPGSPASTGSEATDTGATDTPATDTPAAGTVVFDVEIDDAEFVDATRARRIPYRVYAPVGLAGDVPIALVSHGGQGSEFAFRSGEHIGTTLAANGFLAIHIGHLPSAPGTHRLDRPADVTATIDALEAGTLDLPAEFTDSATADIDRIGHTGHSFGAYTSHAVAGATFDRTFTDERIDAIAAISPQGSGQFRAFDNGPGDSTWSSVTIPAYNLVGGDEVDTNAVDTIDEPGWRLTPFERYPDGSDTYLSVIDGQDHGEMWSQGTAAVDAFVANEILAFFRVYVARDPSADPCAIGTSPLDVAVTFDRRQSVARCPDLG